MTKKMAEAGADAALVVTPCFYKNQMTLEALEKHFVKVDEKLVLFLVFEVKCSVIFFRFWKERCLSFPWAVKHGQYEIQPLLFVL